MARTGGVWAAWAAGAGLALGCMGDAEPEPVRRVWRPELTEAPVTSSSQTSPIPAIDREPHARQATATFALG